MIRGAWGSKWYPAIHAVGDDSARGRETWRTGHELVAERRARGVRGWGGLHARRHAIVGRPVADGHATALTDGQNPGALTEFLA